MRKLDQSLHGRFAPLALLFLFIMTPAAFSVPLPADKTPESVTAAKPAPGNQLKPPDDMPIAGGLNSSIVVPGDTVYTLELIATRFFGKGGTDCWGWVAPDGVEYAIMGNTNGINVWNFVSNRKYRVDGPEEGCSQAYWRDMMTFGHYLYAVSECHGTNEGLMIIDLQYLPDSLKFIGSIPISNIPGNQNTSHNLSIDTVKSIIFIEGTADNTAFMHSLTDPESPQYLGSFNGGAIHDLFVNNDTAYLAQTHGKFSVWKMQGLQLPVRIGLISSPSEGFGHNAWPTLDGKHLVTTEETVDATVKIWNIEDLSDIRLVGQYLGPNRIAHNAQVKGDTIYLSHYGAGVRVVDISDPSAPVEIGAFDTWPESDLPGFEGCWGVWPFSPTGKVFASNRTGHMFILQGQVVQINDSIVIGNGTIDELGNVELEVYARNSLTTHAINISFSWAGTLDLQLDSVSTVGTRTENFESVEIVGINPAGKSIHYRLLSSLLSPLKDLSPGAGSILRIYLHATNIVSGASNPIALGTTLGASKYNLSSGQISLPDIFSGAVGSCDFGGADSDGDGLNDSCDICPSDPLNDTDRDGICGALDNCISLANPDQIDSDGDGIGDACDACPDRPNPCQCCFDGDEGDANSDSSTNIADVTFLIARIFAGGQAPECHDKADADANSNVNIADVTFLIARIFAGGPEPACGPTGI